MVQKTDSSGTKGKTRQSGPSLQNLQQPSLSKMLPVRPLLKLGSAALYTRYLRG